MKEFNNGKAFKWATDKDYPTVVGVMFDYICGLFEHRKPSDTSASLPTTLAMQESIHTYHQFFMPGKLDFTFPCDVAEKDAPSPYYHALQDTTIMVLDWKLAFPNLALQCYNCKNDGDKSDHYLIHDRKKLL
jgi:hypothetical protein